MTNLRPEDFDITDEVYDYEITEMPDGTVLVSYTTPDPYPHDREDPLRSYSPWAETEGEMWKLFDNGAERDAWIEANITECADCGQLASDHPVADDGYGDPCPEFVHPNETVRQAMTDGRFIWIERYEHGLVRYAPTGESSQVDRRWDVAPGVGFMIVDTDWRWGDDGPIEVARAVLDEYSDWCNGSIYGIVHRAFRRRAGMLLSARDCPHCHVPIRRFAAEDDDGWDEVSNESCWGYIGWENARDEMKAEHASMASVEAAA